MKRMIQLSAFILAIAVALPAFAMELDEAKGKLESVKQQGLAGETPTGYLDVVRSGGEAREVVEAINRARREEYTRIAEKHDIPVTQVETVAGQKAIEKTPSGQFVLVEGQWVKK
ncbi:MAG: YdbL family protein [Pseudomonadota bacterium]